MEIQRIIEQIHIDELRRIGSRISQPPGNISLLEWLTEKFPFYSNLQWLEQIENKRITVNQHIQDNPNHLLSLGDQLARVHPLSEEPEVNTHIEVLWKDDYFAAVSKPAGLTMHESAMFRRKTVHWLLPKVLGLQWHAVHRLDRETSGILLCAKGTQNREHLAQELEKLQIRKTYLALVHGKPEQTMWSNTKSIIPASNPRERTKCVSEYSSEALQAHTDFFVLKIFDNQTTLLQANPLTGRTHQIRVHLADSGLPIVGDKLYGFDPSIFEEYLKFGNTADLNSRVGVSTHRLHAWKVCFSHPLTHKPHEIETKLPPWAESPIILDEIDQ